MIRLSMLISLMSISIIGMDMDLCCWVWLVGCLLVLVVVRCEVVYECLVMLLFFVVVVFVDCGFVEFWDGVFEVF